MGKKNLKGYIVDAIVFVVFSVIAFAAPFKMNAVFWCGYVFGVIAILLQIYFFHISFSKGDDVKSKFYGFPIAKIGVMYLGVQMALSLVEFLTAAVLPLWLAVIINVLPIAFAAIGSIAADVMREEIVRQDVEIKKDVNNMRGLQSLSASLPSMCQEPELKKLLQNLADEFKYSDPVSSDETMEMESELKFMMNEIQRALVDGDEKAANEFCTRAKASLAERNRVCKLGK